MMKQEDVTYHSERALRELHLGLAAPSISVAGSHLQLSFFMKKVLDLRGPGRNAGPLCIID